MRTTQILFACLLLAACGSDPNEPSGDKDEDEDKDKEELPFVAGPCLVTVSSEAGVETYDYDDEGRLRTHAPVNDQPVEYEWSADNSRVSFEVFGLHFSQSYAIDGDEHWIVENEFPIGDEDGNRRVARGAYLYVDGNLVRIDSKIIDSDLQVFQSVLSYEGGNLVSLRRDSEFYQDLTIRLAYDNSTDLVRAEYDFEGFETQTDFVESDTEGKPIRIESSGQVASIDYAGAGCKSVADAWQFGLPSFEATW